ncbi:MAG TPA: CoA transferase [Acidimicrobiales bacterium]|nr:CoA transferase [Acidimicrobiales bacterium]
MEHGDEAAWGAARSWARSGVMGLCGHPGGPPLLPPLSVASKLSEMVTEVEQQTATRGRPVRVSWEAALAGRAALLGLTRQGAASPNRSCRLLEARCGEVALNLSRNEDVDMVPALTGNPGSGDHWTSVAAAASRSSASEFVSRARMLGLAAAVPGERRPGAPYQIAMRASPKANESDRPWTVVDLSSLWAGPLAARILAEAGARVTKVEDPSRLDGARQSPSFFSWLHPSSERTERFDFKSPAGRKQLAELIDSADVVIEASRPRALEQVGLSPDERNGPDGQVWLSITAHGRTGEGRNWAGFGDDAAIAGALTCRDADGRTMFCGDAIADPITGLAGGLAVLKCLARGGGQLIDLSLSGMAAWAATGDLNNYGPEVRRTKCGWSLALGDRSEPINQRPEALDLVGNF